MICFLRLLVHSLVALTAFSVYSCEWSFKGDNVIWIWHSCWGSETTQVLPFASRSWIMFFSSNVVLRTLRSCNAVTKELIQTMLCWHQARSTWHQGCCVSMGSDPCSRHRLIRATTIIYPQSWSRSARYSKQGLCSHLLIGLFVIFLYLAEFYSIHLKIFIVLTFFTNFDYSSY
jgi:hypothetical protein